MTNNDRKNQLGSASLFVSLAILIVLSLISASFLTLMTKNYTQANQRRNLAQAKFAAESAINDARHLVYEKVHRLLTSGALLTNPYSESTEFGLWRWQQPNQSLHKTRTKHRRNSRLHLCYH